MNLENKLNLYQIFQQLYTDRPELLADLLNLENIAGADLPQGIAQQFYVMGVVEDEAVYLVTNLLTGRTQKLEQPQGIWTIGRGQDNALTIMDEHLSRHHAAIQYIATQGFFVHDLQSTNGTFLNHELVAAPIQLRDGDRFRVGGTVCAFFCCQRSQKAPRLSDALLTYFAESTPTHLPEPNAPAAVRSNLNREHLQARQTAILLQETGQEWPRTQASEAAALTAKEQGQVLDRFFQRQAEEE